MPKILADAQELMPHQRSDSLIEKFIDDENSVSRLNSMFNKGFQTNINERFQTVAEFKERVVSLEMTDAMDDMPDILGMISELSNEFLVNDRVTQLSRFKDNSMNYFNAANELVNHYVVSFRQNKFNLGISEGGLIDVFTYDESTPLDMNAKRISLNSALHLNNNVLAFYQIRCKEMQCSVYSGIASAKDNVWKTEKDVVSLGEWYDGNEPIPKHVIDSLNINVKKDIALMINILKKLIQS